MSGTLCCSWISLRITLKLTMTPLKSQLTLGTHFMALGHWINGVCVVVDCWRENVEAEFDPNAWLGRTSWKGSCCCGSKVMVFWLRFCCIPDSSGDVLNCWSGEGFPNDPLSSLSGKTKSDCSICCWTTGSKLLLAELLSGPCSRIWDGGVIICWMVAGNLGLLCGPGLPAIGPAS